MNTSATGQKQVYQIKITLSGSKPPIWRRLLVPADITLARLHKLIQTAMPWGEEHLHEFRIGSSFYGVPSEESPDDATINEKLVTLAKVARGAKARFLYVYDFGDDWQHEIRVEKILSAVDVAIYPLCTAGQNACPPDNSGSLWGYYDKLEILKHPEHPAFDETSEWMGADWDPVKFDIDDVNEALKDA